MRQSPKSFALKTKNFQHRISDYLEHAMLKFVFKMEAAKLKVVLQLAPSLLHYCNLHEDIDFINQTTISNFLKIKFNRILSAHS